MHKSVTALVLTLAFYELASSFDFNNIVFIVVSQRDPYNAAIAKRLKQDIENQTQLLNKGQTTVHLTHEDFQVPGDYTIVPLMHPLLNKYKNSDVRWVVFIEPLTAVRCDKLLKTLAAADVDPSTKWIGYAIEDSVEKLLFPYFAVGFAMRLELMDTFLHQLATNQGTLIAKWSAEPSFDLAKLIHGDRKDPELTLTADSSFCLEPADHCATYQKQTEICGSPIPEHSILFAVKTWSGYHESRARVVKNTWGQHVTNIVFFSDKDDPTIPSIDTGVPNVPTGHCLKTMTIFKMVTDQVKTMPHVKWIFLADDDTILGVHRLTEVLSCYKGGSEFIVLGQRYGYNYKKRFTSGSSGFNSGYLNMLVTGGGAVFSVAAAAKLSKCPCQALTYPDDMAISECARFNNYTLIHSPLFHQRQPRDYAHEMLVRDKPISFHQYGDIPPGDLYETWFQRDDRALQKLKDEF